MSGAYDLFVIFAEMRTGSNLLEASLNEIEGLTCHGEVFNPHFIGWPGTETLLGRTLDARVADPEGMLATMRAAPGLNGFRYFHDHDPRVFERVMQDRRCAKIVLNRNPLESFVSLQLARQTGQWRLGDAKHHKAGQVAFEAAAFEAHLEAMQAAQLRLMRALQESGQAAFHLDYEDLQEPAVLAGLARYLGLSAQSRGPSRTLVKQNPEPLEQKVANFDGMEAALARLDRFNLSRTPNFEPRRGPGVPGFMACATAPLLYMPLKAGPVEAVADWLQALGDGSAPIAGFTQKTLRQWMREQPGHRRFTVLRHPVARAHAAFCDYILNGTYAEIREILRKRYRLPLPPVEKVGGMDLAAHRAAFLAFARFLKGNLAGGTAVRIDGAWASQTAIIEGYAQFALPDLILREEDLAVDLPRLAEGLGAAAAAWRPDAPQRPFALAEVLTPEIEQAIREAYARDYLGFGFAQDYLG